MQDPMGKVKGVSAQHLQFMYLAECYVTTLPQIEMFGRTTIFINHPGLMLTSIKTLDDDRHAAVDKQTVSTKSTRHIATGHLQATPHNYNLWPCKRNFVHMMESKIKLDWLTIISPMTIGVI